jgi:hypothetical protein
MVSSVVKRALVHRDKMLGNKYSKSEYIAEYGR